MIADGSLAEVPGIGATMLAKITQLATTGSLPSFEDLKRATPPGLVALLRVPGLGPKKIKLLHDELKVESLADLRAAGESGQIAALKGFGGKTEAKILEGIDFLESVGDRVLQSTARRLIAPIFAAVRAHPGVIRAEVCGSLRRRAETIGDLDILFSSADPGPVLDHFVGLPEVAKVLAHGAVQGQRPAPRRGPVRPPGGGRRPVPLRPPLLHRLARPQHRDATAGDRPGAQAERVWPRRPGRADRLPDRGRPVPGPRPGRDPPRASRRPGRVRAGRGRADPPPGRALRPDRDLPLPHRLERRRRHPGRDGRRRPGRRPVVPRDRRPFEGGGLRRRALDRPGPPAVGRDRRAERASSGPASGSSRGPSATSWPTGRSTSPTTSSPASTTSSPASTPVSGWTATR